MSSWFLLRALFLVFPGFGFAAVCVSSVLRAEYDRQWSAFWGVFARYVVLVLFLAISIYFLSAMAGMSGHTSDAYRWMTANGGLYLAALGWLAPIIVTAWVLDMDSDKARERWVWLAPVPFMALALYLAGFFALNSAP